MKSHRRAYLASFTFLLVTSTSVRSSPLKAGDVDPDLVPQFQWVAGINPTGTGNCDGAVIGSDGKPIQVPCTCPPPRDQFIASLNANVAAGDAVNNPSVQVQFPEDDSTSSAITRMEASIITLQNMQGLGKGCPTASTTFDAQLAALEEGLPPPPAPSIPGSAPTSVTSQSSSKSSSVSATPPPPTSKSTTITSITSHSTSVSSPPASPPPSTTLTAPSSGPTFPVGTPATSLTPSQIDSITPPFGHAAGINPNNFGTCDGAVIDPTTGLPILVPCSCPPPRDLFINDLIVNIDAGLVVNNTGIFGFEFPTDDSVASQQARFVAASDTLQNYLGLGMGCPVDSTTWAAQEAAITGPN